MALKLYDRGTLCVPFHYQRFNGTHYKATFIFFKLIGIFLFGKHSQVFP